MPRIVPSKNSAAMRQIVRLMPSAPPQLVGSSYARGRPNPVTFMIRMPSTAMPRVASSIPMRSSRSVGARVVLTASCPSCVCRCHTATDASVRADAGEVISARNDVRSSRIFDLSSPLPFTAGQPTLREMAMGRTLPTLVARSASPPLSRQRPAPRAPRLSSSPTSPAGGPPSPSTRGETSRIVLHFLEENGKQAVRISLLAHRRLRSCRSAPSRSTA